MRGLLRFVVLAAALAWLLPAQAQTTRQQLRELQVHGMAAYKAGDFAQAAKDFAAALALRPHHPGLLFNFAATSAKAGHVKDALDALDAYADMGLIADVHDTDFDGIKDDAAFKTILAKIDRNRAPVGTASLLATIGGAPFLAEGFAFDPATRRTFVSSVDQRKIVVVSPSGAAADFVPSSRDGLLGGFGMSVDSKRNLLWLGVSGMPHARDLQPAERGMIGVFAFSLADGKLARRTMWKPDRGGVIGDLAWLADDDTIYATDSTAPRIYSFAPSEPSPKQTVWLENDAFVSLQGVTTTPDASALIVADYAMGLHFIDRKSKTIETVSFAGGTTLLGIDGLYRDGNRLIAVQNGINPQRIVALYLAPNGRSIAQVQVLSANDPNIPEPSLGAVVGNRFCAVANAQWSRFDDNGTRKQDLDPVRVACVALAHTGL